MILTQKIKYIENYNKDTFKSLIENYKKSINDNKNKIEKEDYPNILSWKFITNLAVSNFNKRYSHLNENEKKLLKVLLSSEDKKINYLADLKNENLNQIDKTLNSDIENETEKLLINFKEKIINLSENK